MVVIPAVAGSLWFAVIEEIIYRGVLLRVVEERLGTWVALVGSSLAFAAFHFVVTPNATLWTAGSIFVAGLMLGGAYVYTRRLWFPIALHAAWNFTQGAVFGIAVSGNQVANDVSLLVGETSGPTWLSGGAYGFEGSIIAVLIVGFAAGVFLWWADQRNRIVALRRH
ncbi:CPBP family intramembrane glutamic endopeptidase [Halococcus hamelinensis]|uniref:Abortive infection protein n=1 Tax=Halococcus hamelinensis 100A6 TaxID=1132509 RepID=M0MC78_9EURY|nr:CPBP family intramembrane glutamic endopeptidase [Halococcus hamelinensis]EMA41985.1 abortive infection protein [Halococcus hamelinensis 100A6]